MRSNALRDQVHSNAERERDAISAECLSRFSIRNVRLNETALTNRSDSSAPNLNAVKTYGDGSEWFPSSICQMSARCGSALSCTLKNVDMAGSCGPSR